MKRRMIACAVAAALLTGAVPCWTNDFNNSMLIAHADTLVLAANQLVYEKFADYVQITDVKANLSGSVEFPSTIEGLPVKVIGDDDSTIFSYREYYTTGGSSLYSSVESITEVVIPSSVSTIKGYAFYGCTALESVEIPSSVTEIGDYSFSFCSDLYTVDIPETGENMTIGDAAFIGCTTLTSITVPDRVTDMGGGCLAGCTNLQYVTLSSTMTKLYDATRDSALGSYGSKFGFFENCSSIVNLKLPDAIASVDERAFTGCSSLSKITIGASLTELGNISFDLETLTEINVSEDNASYSSENGVLFNKDKTKLIRYPKANGNTEYTIPESVTSLETAAFSDSLNLTSVTVPVSVTKIPSNTFKNCTRLKKITINNPDCVIYANPETIYKDATIVGYLNSTAEEYAETYSRTFEAIDGEDTTDPTDTTEPTDPDTTITLTPDVNQDGNIDAVDAAWILQYAAAYGAGYTGSIEDFVAEKNA